jgi:hypothetical protein
MISADLSNSCFVCLFFLFPVSTCGFWAFCPYLPRYRYRYDVAELKKGRVSLAKHARTVVLSQLNPTQSCEKWAWAAKCKHVPLIPGSTHSRASCAQARYAQSSKHATTSFYLSIHPSSIHPSDWWRGDACEQKPALEEVNYQYQ